jgi:methyl-accepting chemotaxis protein
MGSAEKMRMITQHVERSQKEQAQGNKLIGTAIEAISQMVNNLHRAQRAQTRATEDTESVVQRLKELTREHDRRISALASASDRLHRVARRDAN